MWELMARRGDCYGAGMRVRVRLDGALSEEFEVKSKARCSVSNTLPPNDEPTAARTRGLRLGSHY